MNVPTLLNRKDAWKAFDRPKIYPPNTTTRVVGFDTEGNPKNANQYLICCAYDTDPRQEANQGFFFTSDPFDLFEFFLSHGSHSINWVYNLSWDFQQSIKRHVADISVKKGKKAALEAFRKGEFVLEKNGKSLTIKSNEKYFMVSDGRHKQARVYDAANFYKKSGAGGSSSLDEVSKSVLGYGKEAFGVSDKEIDIERPESLPLWMLVKRCHSDALLTARLGNAIMKTSRDCGLRPRSWNSPASIAKENVIRKGADGFLKQLTLSETSLGVMEYGFRAYKGAAWQVRVKGRVDGVSEADIVSAYPDVMCQLPDLRYGVWHEVEEMTESASYGVYLVRHEFDGCQPVKGKTGRVFYPITIGSETRFDYVTAPEIRWYRARGLKVVVLHGYEFWHDSNTPVRYPLKEVLMPWFDTKKRADIEKNESLKILAKNVLNST